MSKMLKLFIGVLFCTAQAFGQAGGKLQRTVTEKMPKRLDPYYPRRHFSVSDGGAANAVIVRSDDETKEEWAAFIRKTIHTRWEVDLPVVSWEEAKEKHQGKALILFGGVNENTPLRQLNANFQLGDNQRGYELRTIFNALDWQRNVIYIGARSRKEVDQAVTALFSHIEDPETVTFFIDCEGWETQWSASRINNMVDGIQTYYDSRSTYVVTQNIIRDSLKKVARLYKMTGDPVYAKTFARIQKIVMANYGKDTGGRKDKVPSFTFHLYPQYVYLMEHDDAFTAEDRQHAAEFMRKIVEEMMEYYEMKKPIELYETSRQEYLTNHPCFASRSVSSAARYLLSRYGYEPARYWMAVADNAFAGVAPHPFSPEDAAGYQYLVYKIFMDYALASGRYGLDFFKSGPFADYMSYVKWQLNHLGYTAGFGDAKVIGHTEGRTVLQYAADILGDREAGFLLDLIEHGPDPDKVDYTNAPGTQSLGLYYQEVVPSKQEWYGVGGYYNRPTLDKAMFRSGWRNDADFLSVTGINGDGYNHGHYDANGISQYIAGDKLWLWEGDYIKKWPYDHNSIEVNRNGKVPDLSRLAPKRRKLSLSQVLAAGNTPGRDFSLLSMLLEDYNGADWIRNINYAAGEGFWVVDELDIKEAGDYTVQAYWRTTGEVSCEADTYKVEQRKADEHDTSNTFFIVEGSGATSYQNTAFEMSHTGRVQGNLERYRYSDRNTQYIIQRREGSYGKGDKVYFVNYMQAVPGNNPRPPDIRKVADQAFAVLSGSRGSLAVMGSFSDSFFDIDADICFIGPEGIVARGMRRLHIGPFRRQSEKPEDVFIPLPESVSPDALSRALATLHEKADKVLPGGFRPVDVAGNKKIRQAVFRSDITAIASTGSLYAIGERNRVVIKDRKGREVVSRKFKRPITAIGAIKTSEGAFWAVGIEPIDRKARAGHLYLLDQEGNILWHKDIPEYHERAGTVKTIFTAAVKGAGSPLVIAGAGSWHYYAFDLSGNQVWKQQVTHGATVGAAGDMDGDATDEIAAGEEYYYHSIIKDGKKLPGVTTSPFDCAVVVTDLNGDGLKEAVFGRGDGCLYVQAVEGNPIDTWRLNIGGKPTAIVEMTGGQAKLAVSNALGGITFVNGDGEAVGTVMLPAAIEDMVVWKGQLYAICVDGFLYRLAEDGGVVEKYPYSVDSSSIYSPKIVCTDHSMHFFSGKKVFSIRD